MLANSSVSSLKAMFEKNVKKGEEQKVIPKKNTGVEIGVLYGDFSQMILDILKPELLVLIDPFECNTERYGEALNNITTAYSTAHDFEAIIFNEIFTKFANGK